MSTVSSEEPASPARGVLGFTAEESRVLLGTSAIYALRMLGVYLAFPVLSRYAKELPGSTTLLVGLSVGAYGLTQALFQIPLGTLGDRIGRGRALALGLLIFAVGSGICALGHTAWWLVIGRLVQGAGAMAAMGLFIGGAFALGLIFGAPLSERFGMPALFGFSCVASLVGIAFLPWALGGMKKLPAHGTGDRTLSVGSIVPVLARPPLLAADVGIMLLHLGLTALFVVLPIRLHALLGATQQGLLYAPVLALGFVSMWVSSHIAETPRGTRLVLAIGSLFLATG